MYLQRIKQNLYWKMKPFNQPTYIRYALAKLSKFVQISTQSFWDSFLQSIFTEYSLEIKKGLELMSRPHFSYFLIKIFLLWCYINWPNFMTRLCLLPKLFRKMSFVFHAQASAFDDAMIFEYLKIWLSQKQKELSRWNKKHFSLF